MKDLRLERGWLDWRGWVRDFERMRNFKLWCLWLLWIGGVSGVWGQVPPPAAPAQMVMIFNVEPKEFKTLTLDKKPFASLEVGMEFSTTWPVPGGKHELALTAVGAEEKKMEFSINPKEVGLLFINLGANPDSAKVAQYPKAVFLTWIPMNLPEPDKVARIFAFVPLGGKSITGEVIHGNEAGVKVEMTPGKLTPLGAGKTAVMVDGKSAIFVNPGGPGVYVSVLLEDGKGGIRSVPFSFEVMEPETAQPPEKKSKGPPADY